jgi:hypothetical protein
VLPPSKDAWHFGIVFVFGGHILNCEITLLTLLPTRGSFLICSFISLTMWRTHRRIGKREDLPNSLIPEYSCHRERNSLSHCPLTAHDSKPLHIVSVTHLPILLPPPIFSSTPGHIIIHNSRCDPKCHKCQRQMPQRDEA